MKPLSIELVRGPDADPAAAPDLLIEVPHGATRRTHFDAVRTLLRGSYPDDLVEFFFVNTDVGAPECSLEIARRVTAVLPSAQVVVVRGLVPRTFVDLNRAVDGTPSGELRDGMTPGLPAYVDDGADADTLVRLHRTYHETVGELYRRVCAGGGLALALHTYAPRSVEIDRVDDGIVAALHRAYEPQRFERWPIRPDVDVITRTTDDRLLAPDGIAGAIARSYASIGVDVAENATYTLHPQTMGYVYADAHPGRVVSVELNRALLADPFDPFREMRISPAGAARMSAPLAAVLVEALP